MMIIATAQRVIRYSSMALSYYSNWASYQQPEYSDTAIDDPELQSLLNTDDYLVDPYDSFCNSLLSDFSNANANANGVLPFDNLNSLAAKAPFLPHQQESFEPFHYPKRQKLCDSQQLDPSLFDPCLAMLQDCSPPEFVMPPPLPEFPAADFSMGSCERVKKEASSGSLSAQSIAARQRRRRITVKTQELGKLVPGGQKMNTAEMLQSAYKYIKFLQAQVALLEFVGSRHQVNEAPFEGEEEFQNLLESRLIQEKLYSTEKCLVPQNLVEQLCCDDQILKSNPHLLPTLEKDLSLACAQF